MQLRLHLSYAKSRMALLELVAEIRREAEALDHATPQQFLVTLASAALLVDAARFTSVRPNARNRPRGGRYRSTKRCDLTLIQWRLKY